MQETPRQATEVGNSQLNREDSTQNLWAENTQPGVTRILEQQDKGPTAQNFSITRKERWTERSPFSKTESDHCANHTVGKELNQGTMLTGRKRVHKNKSRDLTKAQTDERNFQVVGPQIIQKRCRHPSIQIT